MVALPQIKIIAIIFNRRIYQFGRADKEHVPSAHDTEWKTEFPKLNSWGFTSFYYCYTHYRIAAKG